MFTNVTTNEILLFCAIIVFVAMVITFIARSIINYSYERKEKHIQMLSKALSAGLEAFTKNRSERAQTDIQEKQEKLEKTE